MNLNINNFKVGDIIYLSDIPDSILSDLPECDQVGINEMLSKPLTVEGVSDVGGLELMRESTDGEYTQFRTIFISQNELSQYSVKKTGNKWYLELKALY